MRDNKPSLSERLKEQARALGFAACRITHAEHDFGPALQHWLSTGAHGEMGWMEARADQRRGPQALWGDAQSVIMLGMSYAPEDDPLQHLADPRLGNVSVYARGPDYHDVVKKALKALARWLVAESGCDLKVFVDTAPVMEKPLAAAAGLGWQGKHSNLVSRNHGSWLFLGAIYTTLALDADSPDVDHCGSCTACHTACPTNAFPAPYQLDARRCISYLTIEHKGPIPHEFRAAMGNRVYGCDDCLAACPWNKFARTAAANKALGTRLDLGGVPLATLLDLDDLSFRALFKGTPVKRMGRDRMVRNAAIAAGNSGASAYLGQLSVLLEDASETVAEAAGWAINQIENRS